MFQGDIFGFSNDFSEFWWIWGGYLGSLWDTISDLFVLGDRENAALVGSLLF